MRSIGFPAAFAGACASLALGAAAAWFPLPALLAATGLLVLSLGVVLRARLPGLFVASLGILLVGYAFLGKGFAYVGSGPVHVGELVLALGLLALLGFRNQPTRRVTPLFWLIGALCVWGALRTFPYVGTYGLDALRDASTWGYSVFALLVAVFLARAPWLEKIPGRYAQWIPWFLVWVPLATVLIDVMGDVIPLVPGTDVPIVVLKPGDLGVHLAGIGAFLMLGLHQTPVPGSSPRVGWREWAWWILWLVGVVVVSTQNRGGLLAILTALLIAAVLARSMKWVKPLAALTIVALLFVSTNLEIDVGQAFHQNTRPVSAQQFIDNFQSVLSGSDQQDLAGSRDWRLRWWSTVVDYTIFGNYFWGGKGFGINLAADDGFQVLSDNSLRSPHNGDVTILARSGVIGLTVWVALHLTFLVTMLHTYVNLRSLGQDWWARVTLWVLAYWSAFMVNAAFDVFLEGPQGGIWFWSVMGMGMALVLAGRSRAARVRVGAYGPVPAAQLAQGALPVANSV